MHRAALAAHGRLLFGCDCRRGVLPVARMARQRIMRAIAFIWQSNIFPEYVSTRTYLDMQGEMKSREWESVGM
ncbi:hypothetical protein WS69_02480 [Burkholderia sp. BDU5]|nr:hypothetical protein WS69_02480 [Burkholderia sp. BDU5]